MFYFIHYFLCELSFPSGYEKSGHPCVIRDIFRTCRLMHMNESKFSHCRQRLLNIHLQSLKLFTPLVSHVYFHHSIGHLDT